MNPIEKQELLEELEEQYHVDVKSGDALVWVFDNYPQDALNHAREHLQEVLPEQEHIVINDLEKLYQLDTGEE